ncbi:MAG: aromatic amino acid lyase, partial [Alkalispirochaeta sp.]
RVRGHPGQGAVASAVRTALEPIGAPPDLVRPAQPAGDTSLQAGTDTLLSHEETLQSAYSFRCIPQILGPSVEMLWQTGDTLEREINAVTDNPVFAAPDQVFHGGNFHGQIVAQACDSLALGVANLAILLDRQIARITDPLLNHGLPPFLTGAAAGAHSGLMGAQVSATALTAELSASAQRRYLLQSRSTNGANQDVVSMSTLAGVAVYESLPRLRELAAIHLITAVQAAELTGITGHEALRRWTRESSPYLSEDRALSEDIQRIAERLALQTANPRGAPEAETPSLPPAHREIWNSLFPDVPPPGA